MSIRASLTCVGMALLVSACGGGTSGGLASTPGPTPAPSPTPTPTNTTLTDLKVSQAFTNDAAVTNVALDLPTGTGISGTAARKGLTISYDAAAQTYTVTQEGRSQTFAPADIQPSDAGDVRYKKTGTTTNEYLTLVPVPYTSNTGTKYVALGYWQSNARDGSTQNTTFAAFTYGLPTGSSAVPRTGTAGYGIDAFGLVSAPGKEPRSFAGHGGFNVDFGAGVFSTQAYLTESSLVSQAGSSGGGIEILGAGHLSATDGTFAGNAKLGTSYGDGSGLLEGRFYGPAAEELGATFYAANSAGLSAAGGFTGQRDASVASGNLTLTNLTRQQLFYVNFGPNSYGQLTWQNAETFTVAPPSTQFYGGQFTANDKVASSDPNFTAYRKTFSNSYDSQDVNLTLYKPGPQNSELALSYATFGHWATTVLSGTSRTPADLYFAYGLDTPRSLLMAKTGTASYKGIVYGTGTNSQAALTYAITGSSAFTVNFGGQSYSGSLSMIGKPTNAGAVLDFGNFAFSGSLAPYNELVNTTVTRDNQFVGSIASRFYGPDGEEIAGTFGLSLQQGIGTGTSISGAMALKRQ